MSNKITEQQLNQAMDTIKEWHKEHEDSCFLYISATKDNCSCLMQGGYYDMCSALANAALEVKPLISVYNTAIEAIEKYKESDNE